MNILLAGGTGFIGSHILMKLLEKGHTVEVFARNPNKIPALHGMKGVTLTQGDITDSAAAEKALAGKDACVYVALNYNDQNASAMLRSDTLATVSWADAAAKASVKKFIYTSSASANDYVYKTDLPRIEGGKTNSIYEHTKQNPVSSYGAGKAATENFLNAISYETPMKVNIVRPGFTFAEPATEGAPLYADKRFGSIVRAIQEGKRRRNYQERWDAIHLGRTPRRSLCCDPRFRRKPQDLHLPLDELRYMGANSSRSH